MFSGAISTHEFASKLLKAGRLQLLDIAAFYANQEIIHLKDLYPGNDVYTAFLIRRDRELKLLTIGSKTVTEIKAAGYSFKKSQVPFLASVTLNEHGRRVATSVNLQIHPSHIPNLTKRRVYADQQDSEWGSGEESESPDVP